MENWGYIGLFVAAFLAGTPFPMNCEVVLSALLLKGRSFMTRVLAATIGNWCGTLVNYGLSKLCSYEQVLKYTRVNPSRLERVKNYLTGRGLWIALGSCLPIIGNVLIISYGILQAPLRKVAGIMLIGQIIRFTIWGSFTLSIGNHWG